MNVEEFLALLEAHPDQTLLIALPSGKSIAAHFHVTEIGYVAKHFIDCGGTRHKTESCLLQTWVFLDLHHRLTTTKLANILRLARQVLPTLDLPVEIEYEAEVVSQYPVLSASSDGKTLTLTTGLKHTACLAMDVCCVPAASTSPTSNEPNAKASACCTPSGHCC